MKTTVAWWRELKTGGTRPCGEQPHAAGLHPGPVQLIVLIATGLAAWQFIPDDPIAGGARTALVRAITQAVLYALCLLFGIVRRKRGK